MLRDPNKSVKVQPGNVNLSVQKEEGVSWFWLVKQKPFSERRLELCGEGDIDYRAVSIPPRGMEERKETFGGDLYGKTKGLWLTNIIVPW